MVTTVDETAIRKIVQDEVTAWNRGDARTYSSQFASDGTFTNIRGQFVAVDSPSSPSLGSPLNAQS